MEVVSRLAQAVLELSAATDRVLVGIDGPDAAGKTTLAESLAMALPPAVLRASVDSFAHPRAVRYARGELSPEGYYGDSFDVSRLLRTCLLPFRAGAAQVRTSSAGAEVPVPRRAVLVVDGVFLLHPELRGQWALSVYLRVSPEETLRRALFRDVAVMGSEEQVRLRYTARYLPGQELYRNDAHPETAADVLVDNGRPEAPQVQRWSVRR